MIPTRDPSAVPLEEASTNPRERLFPLTPLEIALPNRVGTQTGAPPDKQGRCPKGAAELV